MIRTRKPIERAAIFIWLLVAILGALAYASLLAIDRAGQNVPALVGYNCEGATGPLYANEESDFPECERIERTR